MKIPTTKNDEGASAVEYGLIVSLIAGAIVAIITTFGSHLVTVFQNVTSSF